MTPSQIGLLLVDTPLPFSTYPNTSMNYSTDDNHNLHRIIGTVATRFAHLSKQGMVKSHRTFSKWYSGGLDTLNHLTYFHTDEVAYLVRLTEKKLMVSGESVLDLKLNIR